MVLNVLALEVGGDLGPIDLADALHRLLQDLQEGVIEQAAPVVGVHARHLLVALVVAADVGVVLNAAGAQHVFRRCAELAAEGRERDPDRAVIGLHVEPLDLGLLGEPERVRRIGPGDERIGVLRLRRLDDRREVLRRVRIGFVVDDVEAGLLEDRAAGIGELDAEGVGDVDDGDAVADLALVLELLHDVRRRLGERAGRALDEEQPGIARNQRVDLVGDGGLGHLRIAVLGEDRRDREIPAGAVDRHDEIDLVLGRQAFHRLDRLGRLAAVVVLDHLDLALAGLELEAAAIVDLLCPELEVRPMGDRGARGHEAGSRSDHADPDGVLGIGGAGTERSRERGHGDKCQRCSSVHSILPVGFA